VAGFLKGRTSMLLKNIFSFVAYGLRRGFDSFKNKKGIKSGKMDRNNDRYAEVIPNQSLIKHTLEREEI
jgi:hypothetical protein